MRKETINFKDSAIYDLHTAEFMFTAGRYIYVIFMCHLSIEKMLKAITAEVMQKMPPKTHNLIYLIKISGIQPPPELLDFIAKINNVSIVTRYPEDLKKLLEAYPKKVTKDYLNKTREVIKWLKKHEILKK